MGIATYAPDVAHAIQQAQANARVEVLTRLRADVQGDTTVQSSTAYTQRLDSPTVGEVSKRIVQDTRIQTHALELPGLVVEEVWTSDTDRTAYALAYLDVARAESELRARFAASQKEDLAEQAVAAEARARLKKLQRMNHLMSEAIILDDMAALLSAASGDTQLRADIRDHRSSMQRRLEALRHSLTFTLRTDTNVEAGSDIAALVRNAVLRHGLGWSESAGEFVLQFRYRRQPTAPNPAKRWWDYQAAAEFVVARGTVELVLGDRAGTAYESTLIEAKGVGVSETTADRALLKAYREKLDSTLSQWLANLEK